MAHELRAREAWAKITDLADREINDDWHRQTRAIIREAIEAAVKAERERCAKIAEQYTCPDPEGSAELIGNEICDEIAARIRKGK